MQSSAHSARYATEITAHVSLFEVAECLELLDGGVAGFDTSLAVAFETVCYRYLQAVMWTSPLLVTFKFWPKNLPGHLVERSFH